MAATTTDFNDQPQELVKGDSDEWVVSVTEPNDADAMLRDYIRLDRAVDGTDDRYAIIRVAAKLKGSDEDNTDALFFKDSQLGASDIQILDQTNGLPTDAPAGTQGQAIVYIDTADTTDSEDPVVERSASTALHDYDVEVNRQDVERSGASGVGTVSVTNGSNTITGTATAFTNAKVGDIVNLLGAGNLARPTLITKIVDDATIEVGRSLWVNVSGDTYEIRRNRRRTGAYGDLFFYRERVSKS